MTVVVVQYRTFKGMLESSRSIIIDAINILLGDRFTTEFIKFGKDESVVEALFQIPPNLGINRNILFEFLGQHF